MARFRQSPQPPEGPALTSQWQSVVGERPEVERAVMLGVLAAHKLIGPSSPPPPPADVTAAERTYRLALIGPHGFVLGVEDVRAYRSAEKLRATIQPEYDYLVMTMGSSRPGEQYVADAFVQAARAAGDADHAFRLWQPVALLVRAAHYTQGRRVVEALHAVDEAVAQVRRIRGCDQAAKENVLAYAGAARKVLEAAIPRQPMPERRRAELDDACREFEMQGLRLYAHDDFDEARECFDRSLALAEQWQAAFPGDARAIRAVAIQLSNRLMCLTEAEQFAEAIPDGRRALHLFQSLRSGVGALVAIEMEGADTEAWLALALAGVAAAGGAVTAGPDPSDAVLRHGTAAMETCQRLGQAITSTSGHARAAALYAKALDLLNDARDGRYDDAALAAEQHALQAYRNRDAQFGRRGEQLTPQDRRYFAQVALSHAIGQFHDHPEAARAAAADFIDQSGHLMLVGLPVHPEADNAQRLWEVGYAEYILAYSELQLGHDSAGQHIANAHYLLSHCPGELPEPVAAAKRELDVIIARWR